MDTTRAPQIVLAPVAAWDAGAPVINGPAVTGASPGKPFLFLVPTVGERPLRFTAEGLPPGLALDAAAGIVSGAAAAAGSFAVRLAAENRHGRAEKILTFVIAEHALALTPPMGWNSWNCFRSAIDEAKIWSVAQGLVRSGLAARGYGTVNLDSGWQSARRGGPFNSIIPHDGFPDMGGLCARIHALGLKMGIYSGPYGVPWGTDGCGSTAGAIDGRFPVHPAAPGKYIGLNKHEAEDAAQWAAWGIDYCKYDWGHTDMELAGRMSRALRAAPRDIVFSITTSVDIRDAQEAARLCNLWRSNGDTSPTWESVVRNGFDNDAWNRVIGPGHWFDLDMTAIRPRDGKSLSRDELATCITRWAIRPSPLLIDCLPGEIDDDTLRLLCNEEVLAVNQDAWGLPAATVRHDPVWPVQAKALSTGGTAVAFYNLGDTPGVTADLDVAWLGFRGPVELRDLWARRDLDGRRQTLSVALPPHGAKLFVVTQ